MRLLYKPDVRSLILYITLCEGDLDFVLQSVDLAREQLESRDDYPPTNPKGQVSVSLSDDDILLTEGVVIMRYIADQVPDRHLLAPAGPIARYQTPEWLNYVAIELHKDLIPLFRPDTPEDYKPTARALPEKKLQYVDTLLENKQWLTGHHFIITDDYLFVVLCWGYSVKLDMATYSHIDSWMAQVAACLAAAAALAAEGLK